MIKASIIMPCYYRPELLNWGLYSLLPQKCEYPYEIIVLNDGGKDETEAVCNKYYKQLRIVYKFTGERNSDGNKWRVPGAAFNEGVKVAQGEIIILSSPEMFHLDSNSLNNLIAPLVEKNTKLLTISEGRDDKRGEFLNHLRTCKGKVNYELYDKLKQKLNTKLPFCMGMRKETFNAIEGFDPVFFNGFCFDDNDFVDRLTENGSTYHTTGNKMIHLFNSRTPLSRVGLTDRDVMWQKNKTLYEARKEARAAEKKTIIKPRELPKKIVTPRNSRQPKNYLPDYITHPETAPGNKDKWELENIPKIAHFYWGNKELPYLRYLTVASFIKYNPNWEIRFYYPKFKTKEITWKTHEHKYDVKIEKDYYKKLKKLHITFIEMDFKLLNVDNNLPEVHKSDYLRWYLLANVGGLWSDMDIIYYDSMNKINVNQVYNKNITSVICYNLRCFSIGFLLGAPNNDFYSIVWDKAIKDAYDPKEYQTMGVVLVNPLMKNFTELLNSYPSLKTANLSMEVAYNYDSHMLKTIYDSTNLDYVTESSIGLHWYAGCLAANKVTNELTESNYKDFDNVVGKIVDISLNEKKKETIADNRGMPMKYMDIKNRKPLTIHTVCKDEPFIYYAVKSVYDYAEKILLYDTGTTDEIALEGLTRLLKEDTENKIVYKTFDIGNEESKVVALREESKPKKKFGVGQIRQIMINDTDTEFFFTVDGDEVFYKGMMDEIVNEIIPNCKEEVYQIGLPLVWFYDINHTCDINSNVLSGRLYKTDKVFMTGSYPDEFHAVKATGEVLMIHSKNFWTYPKPLPPFGHFNLLIKDEKYQYIKRKEVKELDRKLPEVMEEEPYFINKLAEQKKENNNEKV